MGKFGFGQSVRKLHKNKEKVLFYETYFGEGNINPKSLIWVNCTKNARIVRKSVILQNLLRRE